MNYKQIIYLTIMILSFIIGAILITSNKAEVSKKIVDCYDYNNNKIIGVTCEEEIYQYSLLWEIGMIFLGTTFIMALFSVLAMELLS